MTAPTTMNYQAIVRTGLETTYAAVDGTNGNQFQNDGRMFLHVKNGSGAPISVYVDARATVNDLTIVVTNGESRDIGPFPPNLYNDANRRVQVTYSSGTTVTEAVLRL
jgi:hypothetical protein